MTQILDLHGNPIDTGRLREPQTASVSYLNSEWADHPARGLTPAKLNTILRAAEQGDWMQQLDLADDMEERDGNIFSQLQTRSLAVLGLEWDVHEPEGASAEEKKQTAFVKEWLKGWTDFEDVLLSMMSAVLRVFSCQEIVWGWEEKTFLPTSIKDQPHRWFCQDKTTRRKLLLRSQTAGVDGGEPLQPFGWISHVHKSRGGYLARASLVRVLAFPYLFKNFSTRDLAEFLEIYGLPLRVGSYPAGASDAEKRALLRAVVEIGHNAAGIIPQGMKLDFQNAAQGTHVPFETMYRLMDAVQCKAIVGQTLTSGEGEHGTQALGNVHNEVRHDIRDADVRQIQGTFNRDVIWPVCATNFPGANPKRCPQLRLDIGEPEDLAAYADNLPKLAKAGLRISKKWVHDRLRIPEAEEGEEILEAPEPPPAPGAPGNPDDPNAEPSKPGERKPPQRKPAQLKGGGEPEPGQDLLDPLAEEGAAEWQPVMAPIVEPLLAELDRAVDAGESLESFRDRLPELLERMDGKPLAERLAKAMFVGRLAGAADLQMDDNEAP